MTRFPFAILLVCLGAATLPRPASAQSTAEANAAAARLHVGPFALTPRFSLRDVGVDTNVLSTEDAPTRDFTLTAGPGLEAILQVGRVWVTSTSGVEWVYYRRTASQRSVNLEQRVRLDLDLLRVIPHVEGGYDRSRRRINFELDGRLEEQRTDYGGGIMIRPGSRTSIDLVARRAVSDFGDETFGGRSLAAALNRTTSAAGLDFRYAVTPLTTVIFEGRVEQERFESTTSRDSDSVRLVPGLEFEPFALISGEVKVGVQRFETLDDALPDFTGVVAAVDVAYTLRDNVRFKLIADRDVQYSIEELEPFYVRTGVGLEVTKVLGLNWDVVARAQRTELAYRAVEGGILVSGAARTDQVFEYGLGLGRHLGENIRVGVETAYVERNSDRAGRSYSGWRTGGSLTYGF